jgi:hypothetical protein
MRIFVLHILLLNPFVPICCQGQIRSTSEVVADLNQADSYDVNSFQDVNPCKQIIFREELQTTASEEELIQLTKSENPLMRIFSLEALIKNNSSHIYDLLLAHCNDTAIVTVAYWGYDIIGGRLRKESVRDIVFELSSHNRVLEKKIDQWLIFHDNQIQKTLFVLESIKPKRRYYQRVVDLAHEDYYGAIVTLCKFRKEKDIPLIHSVCMQYLREEDYIWLPASPTSGIKYFPHESLFEVLKEAIHRNEYVDITSIIEYENQASADLLLTYINDPEANEYISFQDTKSVWREVNANYKPIYNDLLLACWKKHDFVSKSYLKNYHRNFPTECIEQCKLSLERIKEPSKHDMSGELYTQIMDLVYSKDSIWFRDFLERKLFESNFHLHRKWTEESVRFNDPAMWSLLCSRIEKESNPNFYLPVSEVLLKSKNYEAQNLLLTTLRKNQGIDGWGKEKLIELLASYQLQF